MAVFGEVQSVAGEDDWRVEARRERCASRQHRVLAEDEFVLMTVADEHERRLILIERAAEECHGLDVAVDADRLEARRLERRGDVLGSFLMLDAARVPPTHRIVGQRLDVGPPTLGLRMGGEWEYECRGHEQANSTDTRNDGDHSGSRIAEGVASVGRVLRRSSGARKEYGERGHTAIPGAPARQIAGDRQSDHTLALSIASRDAVRSPP